MARDATPAMGQTALPGGDEATRQMAPTPSLLRAAALSAGKRGGPPRKRSRLPLVVAMLMVAAGGALAGFFVVRAKLRRPAPRAALPIAVQEPMPKPGVAPSPTTPPTATPASPTEKAMPPMATAKTTTPPLPNGRPTPHSVLRASAPAKPPGKPAQRISATPVAVKAPPRRVASSSSGLPHKAVPTDSRSISQQQASRPAAAAPAQMPTVEHESTGETPPASQAEQKQEAEARLDADSVRLVVRQHLPQVRACYGRAFKDSSPGGTVEIGFAIDGGGRAKNVRTETNTTDSESLPRCLETRVREWQFPRPVGGDYELIYPFVFAPGS